MHPPPLPPPPILVYRETVHFANNRLLFHYNRYRHKLLVPTDRRTKQQGCVQEVLLRIFTVVVFLYITTDSTKQQGCVQEVIVLNHIIKHQGCTTVRIEYMWAGRL
jgi:hypothetical protein